jgi:hypothetical protein
MEQILQRISKGEDITHDQITLIFNELLRGSNNEAKTIDVLKKIESVLQSKQLDEGQIHMLLDIGKKWLSRLSGSVCLSYIKLLLQVRLPPNAFDLHESFVTFTRDVMTSCQASHDLSSTCIDFLGSLVHENGPNLMNHTLDRVDAMSFTNKELHKLFAKFLISLQLFAQVNQNKNDSIQIRAVLDRLRARADVLDNNSILIELHDDVNEALEDAASYVDAPEIESINESKLQSESDAEESSDNDNSLMNYYSAALKTPVASSTTCDENFTKEEIQELDKLNLEILDMSLEDRVWKEAVEIEQIPNVDNDSIDSIDKGKEDRDDVLWERAEEALRESQEEVQELKTKLAVIKEAEIIKEQNEKNLKQELEKMKNELDEMKLELLDIKTKNEQYKEEAKQNKTQCDLYDTQVNDQKAKLQQFRSDMKELQNELECYQIELKKSKAEIQVHKNIIEKYKTEIILNSNTADKYKETMVKYDEIFHELECKTKKISEHEEELTIKTAALTEAGKKETQMAKELTELWMRFEVLEVERQNAQTRIEELEAGVSGADGGENSSQKWVDMKNTLERERLEKNKIDKARIAAENRVKALEIVMEEDRSMVASMRTKLQRIQKDAQINRETTVTDMETVRAIVEVCNHAQEQSVQAIDQATSMRKLFLKSQQKSERLHAESLSLKMNLKMARDSAKKRSGSGNSSEINPV